LFVENSQPFPKVLLSVLKKRDDFQTDRVFSAVHAINRMKERRFNLVLVCGRDSGNSAVQDAARKIGASFFSLTSHRRNR